MFFKKGKKITVCLNQCDTSLTCVSIAFSQHIHSFWLSPFFSGYLNQIGLVISRKSLPILLRFLLIFSPVLILGPRIHHQPYFQLTWVGISQGRRSLGFSLQWNFYLRHMHFLRWISSNSSQWGQLLLWASLDFSFILSLHIELILSWKVLSLHWPGEGGTYHKLAELQCTVLWTCKIRFKSLNL